MEENLIAKFPVALYHARAKIENGKVILKEMDFLNSWIEKITGWKLEEIRRDPNWWFENVHPEDRDRVYFECKELAEGRDFITRIYRFKRKDGQQGSPGDVWLLEGGTISSGSL